MFEAHIYSARPSQLNADHELAACEPVLCWHPAQQCNLAVWFTPGKRNGSQTCFVYFEYRRADNSHASVQAEITCLPDYQSLQLLTAEQIISDLDINATQQWHQQRAL